MKILVTGGAGFIGNHLVRLLLQDETSNVVVLDALTYAGNVANLADCSVNASYRFVHGSVTDVELLSKLLKHEKIETVYHLAAETHVDRSIASAEDFVQTNIVGTHAVLESVRSADHAIRLIHVSTDEVYGTLGESDAPFTEQSPLLPTSPYAASKAAADMLVHSYVATHGVDAVITRSCNNYGIRQFPEKLIPLMIERALSGGKLPVYGAGTQRREWIHVQDHCHALVAASTHGRSGEVYNIGSGHEEVNMTVVERIVQETGAHASQVQHVADRPAHDTRYALDSSKIQQECGWEPRIEFDEGFGDTISWYKNEYLKLKENS